MGKCQFSKTIIIGRLGSDPVEIGEKGAMFPILNTSIENSNEILNTHKIYVFGKQKQICMKYLKRGDLCCVEGKRDTRTLKVVCERVTFLSNKKAYI